MAEKNELLARLDAVLGRMEESEDRDAQDIAELVRASVNYVGSISEEDLTQLVAEYERDYPLEGEDNDDD